MARGQDRKTGIWTRIAPTPIQTDLISESSDVVKHWSRNLSGPFYTCIIPSGNSGLPFLSVNMRQIYLNVLVCSLVNDLILFWTGKRLLSSASWFLHNGIALFHNMVSYSICSSGFLKEIFEGFPKYGFSSSGIWKPSTYVNLERCMETLEFW